jgi:hypothetical protein
VFGNRVLRIIIDPKRDEVTGEKCIVRSFIIRMIKSRRMRWVGHVARMGRSGKHIRYICGEARRKETTRKART